MSNPLRVCRECGREARNEADLEKFTKGKRNRYGRRNICKACQNAEECQYYRDHPEKNLEYAKNYHRIHPSQYLTSILLWQKRYPEKRRAHVIAGKNIPLNSACMNCGSTEDIVRHHPNYSKPLEVVILCRKCHGLVHRKELSVQIGGGNRDAS
ncbi:MAG TPA: hypothetical protein VI864_02790 [Candidatus Bathyarchaeia archaeon]|nr:hypothetical protein [Candidatus Bathyarchaeia archaeon]